MHSSRQENKQNQLLQKVMQQDSHAAGHWLIEMQQGCFQNAEQQQHEMTMEATQSPLDGQNMSLGRLPVETPYIVCNT